MHPHPEMHVPCGYCVKLLKSLYGLKQSPRNWNVHLHEYITFVGLRCSQLDHCLYIRTVDSIITVLIAVDVNDIRIASASETVIEKVMSHFHKKFKIKDMGLADVFLKIRITQRPGRISINQVLYIRALLAKYPTYIDTRNEIHSTE